MADNKSVAVYGIKHLKMTPATADGTFPNYENAKFEVRFIGDSTMSFNDTEPSTTDIRVEDMKDPLLQIETDSGSRGFTLEVLDMSEDAYKYLMGFKTIADSEADNPNKGWTVETPDFKLGPQAVELETLAIDKFPAQKYQWAKMKVTVVRAGTIGRGGVPNFTLTFTQMANTDESGAELPGFRIKAITEAGGASPASVSALSSRTANKSTGGSGL